MISKFGNRYNTLCLKLNYDSSITKKLKTNVVDLPAPFKIKACQLFAVLQKAKIIDLCAL